MSSRWAASWYSKRLCRRVWGWACKVLTRVCWREEHMNNINNSYHHTANITMYVFYSQCYCTVDSEDSDKVLLCKQIPMCVVYVCCLYVCVCVYVVLYKCWCKSLLIQSGAILCQCISSLRLKPKSTFTAQCILSPKYQCFNVQPYTVEGGVHCLTSLISRPSLPPAFDHLQ